MLTLSSPTSADVMASYPARAAKIAPLHPGAIIADILDEQRISLRAAAKAIGMSPTGLDKVLKGVSAVTPETALRIGAWLGNGPELWLNLQHAHDLWNARKALHSELKTIKPLAGR